MPVIKLLLRYLLLGNLTLSTGAIAQVDTGTMQGALICPVEPMPELWIAGKAVDVVKVIQQKLIYPPAAMRARAEGRVFISFTVTVNGAVREARVVKGFRPDCDAAALHAVRQLPRFKAVQQDGKPVASRLTVPIRFSLHAAP